MEVTRGTGNRITITLSHFPGCFRGWDDSNDQQRLITSQHCPSKVLSLGKKCTLLQQVSCKCDSHHTQASNLIEGKDALACSYLLFIYLFVGVISTPYMGLELTSLRLRVECSSNWASHVPCWVPRNISSWEQQWVHWHGALLSCLTALSGSPGKMKNQVCWRGYKI